MSPTAQDADTSRGHQRVGMACTYCRRRKIRCDGDHKCANCVRTKQVCIYAAVDSREQTTLKETRRAVFPQQRGSSSAGGRGGATRGVGASKRKGAGGRKRRASKDSEDDEDDDDFYAGEPIREVAPGRVIVVVGTSTSRGRTQTEQSSSGHSSTSSPTPLTPRSASEADWDRSPHHPHSNLHPHSKTHYTHPPITQANNYSNSSSPSSVASSSNPALSARSSPNVGPGGALPPAWVPAWTPTATSPYFPSVLLGSGYTYDDAVRLDRDQRTVLPGASPSKSPHQALHPLPTSQQQQQHRQQQHQRIQGSGSSSSSSSGPGGQSALGFFTNNNNQNGGRSQVVGNQIPLYPLPTSSSSSSNLNQPSLLAPSAITPDLYQTPLPESEYDVPFDYSRLSAYPSSFLVANSFNHHRSNSSHSTASNVSDSHSSYDSGNFHLPSSSTSSSINQRSYSSSSSVPRRSSQLSNDSQHSPRHRAQTDGAMPYNSSLFADHQALFEGLSGDGAGYTSDGSSFALDLSIEGGGRDHGGVDFLEAGITGWNGGEFGF